MPEALQLEVSGKEHVRAQSRMFLYIRQALFLLAFTFRHIAKTDLPLRFPITFWAVTEYFRDQLIDEDGTSQCDDVRVEHVSTITAGSAHYHLQLSGLSAKNT